MEKVENWKYGKREMKKTEGKIKNSSREMNV